MKRTVAVIADASALTTDARLDGLAFGELHAEIESEPGGRVIGVPVAAFLDAYQQLGRTEDSARERLIGLVTDPDRAIVILPLAAHNMLDVLDYPAALPTAQCLAEAVTHNAMIATYADQVYREHLPAEFHEDLILNLVEP